MTKALRYPPILALALAFAATSALGQSPRATPDAPPATPARPRPPAPPAKPVTIEDLFQRLAKAKTSAEGRGIAARIERIWSRTASDTANLLMSRATRVMQGENRDLALALELLDRIIELNPEWAEAWNRRATAFFLLGDMQRAMLDVRHAISLEPRHFGAYAGLGHILAQLGENKQALAAYKRALELHPQLEAIKTAAEKLAKEVGGTPI